MIRARRRSVAIALLLLISMVSLGQLLMAQRQATEYEVKAAFLYNFAKFVQWPPEAFKADDDLLMVGVLGNDPFGPQLDQMLEGKTVQSHKVVVNRVATPEDAKDCHVLFVSSSEEENVAGILKAIEGKPILTVSDMRRFSQRGGMIELMLEEQKVRFAVNMAASEAANLKLSSELLKLAKAVRSHSNQ